jgi:hypothetical protein
MISIKNLTPHPVTIIRGGQRTEYPACAPTDLPRATVVMVPATISIKNLTPHPVTISDELCRRWESLTSAQVAALESETTALARVAAESGR